MISKARITVFSTEVSGELFEELCAASPESLIHGYFEMNLPYDAVDARKVYQAFSDHGYSPENPRIPPSDNQYKLELTREYTKEDFAACEWISPTPAIYVDAGRTEEGTMLLAANEEDGGIVPDMEFATASLGVGLIVSDRFRREMEEAGLQHLVFKPTELYDEPKVMLPGPFWELTSDLVLPPLSPRMYLDDENNLPFDGDLSKAWYCHEGPDVPDVLYKPSELHYTRSAIEHVEAFDLACTLERLDSVGRHRFVASRRFYQFITERHLPMEWTPVRIDEG